MNYPNNIEQKLGFDQIKEQVKQNCLTETGKKKIDQLIFLNNHSVLTKELSIVDEMREILVLDYHFPLSYFDNLSSIFEKLKIEDAQINLIELIALKHFMDVLRAVIRFFEDEKHQKFKNLSELSGQTTIHKYVIEQINAILNNKDEIKDSASAELMGIRRSMRIKRNDISKKVNSIYAHVKQSGWLESKHFFTHI